MSAGLIHSIDSVSLSDTEHRTGPDDRNIDHADLMSRFSRLTPRQRQVLRLVVMGMTSKQIAGELGLSARTIEVHRAHLMMRIGTNRLPQLVRWATVCGF